MRLLERFEHQTAAAEFLDFRPTLFFGVPTVYVRLLAMMPETAREIGIVHAACLSPARRRFRPRFWKSSASFSATPFWSATG